ncbi:MAG: phytanoyl-CoA dioxygenase family protein [Actinobacteria bacterium]|nr:phytanoyl-CoA dioxygenase family protein [Actinomycetota bacterium]
MRDVTDPAAATAPLAGATLAAHLDRIAEQGYTVVPGAIEPDLVDELVEVLSRLEHDLDVKPARNRFEGTSTIRIYNLLAHHPVFARVPVHPHVLPLVEGVLDAGCLVSSLSSIAIDPGERAQPIHADDQLMPLAKPHVATVCNSMWALTDFTEANGATRLVPGSHLADASPDLMAHHDTIPAEMEKGSVLVWHGSLWHGGGANTTSHRRIGLAMNYCAGWVRQQENQQVGIPLATLRTFEPRLRELCGFGVYHGLIGHIDRRDPADVVLGPHPPAADPTAEPDPTAPTRMVWDGA